MDIQVDYHDSTSVAQKQKLIQKMLAECCKFASLHTPYCLHQLLSVLRVYHVGNYANRPLTLPFTPMRTSSFRLASSNKWKTPLDYLVRRGAFLRVDLKFLLEGGHSFSICDRQFGYIQQLFNTKEKIEIPQEWELTIQNSHFNNVKSYLVNLDWILNYI